MRQSSSLAIVAIVTAGIFAATPAVAHPDDGSTVDAIIARSKATQTSYAAYFWNRIALPGQEPVEEWSAEFNAGTKHRVETPRDRVVADCKALTGAYLSIVTGKIETGAQVTGAACGIDTTVPLLKAENLGRVTSRFGAADRVRLTDAHNIRTYDISDKGIILRTTYQTNDRQQLTVLELEPVAIFDDLPDASMFDPSSLAESFVPDRFRQVPK